MNDKTRIISPLSKKGKFLTVLITVIPALWIALKLSDISAWGYIQISLYGIIAELFKIEKIPFFAEFVEHYQRNILYFELDKSVFYYAYVCLKIVQVIIICKFFFDMFMRTNKISGPNFKTPKEFDIKKAVIVYIVTSVIVSTASSIPLSFAIHSRTEANETQVIHSSFDEEDTVLFEYDDAEKVKLYIHRIHRLKTLDDFYPAVDVTSKGKTYTFIFRTPDEDLEKFISLFDEDIIEIDYTHWDDDEFLDYTYDTYKDEFNRIFKK